MVIARSLTTLLSFKVDKKGFNNFNSLINGVKSNLLNVGTLLTGTFLGVTKILSSMSTSILDIDQLSRSTGIATKELVGFQKALGTFRIDETSSKNALKTLDELRKDAINGTGELFEIANRFGFEIRDSKGEILPLMDLFERVLEGVGRIKDSSRRANLAQTLFGDEKFADVAEKGIENFRILRKSLEYLAADFEKNKEAALEFEQSLNMVMEAGKALAYQVFPPLFNIFSSIFNKATQLVKAFSSDVERLKSGEIYQSAKQKISLSNQRQSGRSLDNLSRGVFGEKDALKKNIEVSNTINIEIPFGTPETQVQFLQTSAQESFDAMFNNRFLDILSDNPATE